VRLQAAKNIIARCERKFPNGELPFVMKKVDYIDPGIVGLDIWTPSKTQNLDITEDTSLEQLGKIVKKLPDNKHGTFKLLTNNENSPETPKILAKILFVMKEKGLLNRLESEAKELEIIKQKIPKENMPKPKVDKKQLATQTNPPTKTKILKSLQELGQ